jgi:hypothetical protein
MSSSTIPTKVEPGQRTTERLAAYRERMLADRGTIAEGFTGERTEELRARGVEDAETLGGLRARLDAAAPIASPRQLAKTRSVLDRAEEDGSIEEARAAIDGLEVESLDSWADRTERGLLLEELAERAGVHIKPGSVRLEDDGRLTASVEIPGEGTSPVVVVGSRAAGDESGTSILWQVSRSDIRGDGTQEGDCATQEEAIRKVVRSFGDGMTQTDGKEAREPNVEPSHVTRRAP